MNSSNSSNKSKSKPRQMYKNFKGQTRARVKPDPEPTLCPHCKKNMIYGGFAICGPCHQPYAERLIKGEIEV